MLNFFERACLSLGICPASRRHNIVETSDLVVDLVVDLVDDLVVDWVVGSIGSSVKNQIVDPRDNVVISESENEVQESQNFAKH